MINPINGEAMPTIRKTAASYGIDLTDTQFLKLQKWEDANGCWPSVIHDALEKIDGVTMVEMNGHFGASIFVRVDAEYDTTETHKAILAKIRDMIHQSWNMKI